MKHQPKRMRNLFVWASLLSAIIIATLPAPALSDTPQNAIIATAAADYTSGAHCVPSG